MTQQAETQDVADHPPVVIKKYANRRLYNTESSSYITLDTLAVMVSHGRDFVVYDARTGDDITRSVLTQIIVEEEAKGKAALPTSFLRQLIGFYGGAFPALMPRYVEQTMSGFARQQEQVRSAVQQTMGSLMPPGLEEIGRQNMAMMERALSLFSPFYRPGATTGEPGATVPPAEHVQPEDSVVDELIRLRAEVALLKTELALAQQSQHQPALHQPALHQHVPHQHGASEEMPSAEVTRLPAKTG